MDNFWQKVAYIAIFATGFLLGLSVHFGLKLIEATNPVCHAITEDSVITDCDYRNGAWYRK